MEAITEKAQELALESAIIALKIQYYFKKNRSSVLVIAGSGAACLGAALLSRRTAKSDQLQKRGGRKERHGFNKKFLDELRQLLRIMIPTPWSKEAALLLVHSGILCSRTFISIYVAHLEARIVQSIVRKNMGQFAAELTRWILIAIPATLINSLIKFFESYIGLAFRSRLVDKAYQMYFKAQTYYRVSNMDSRIPNADQCLTEDISQFAENVARLYSDLTKPLLDILAIGVTLMVAARARGSEQTIPVSIMAFACIFVTARILRFMSPRFGDIVAEEAKRKGELRHTHARIIANAEEIAFYNGHEVEHGTLLDSYNHLKNQSSKLYKSRILYIMLEQFLMKYVWSGTGMIMVAVPTLTAKYASDDKTLLLDEMEDGGVGERTKGFTMAKHMLTNAADAAERLMGSYKKITELAGYTSRVSQMFRVFRAMEDQEYVKTAVKKTKTADKAAGKRGQALDNNEVNGQVFITKAKDGILIDSVPIVTPNGDVVLNSLTATITPGMQLLITGPNGCGKSSLFRILAGLWPVYRGTLRRPATSDIYYVPQKPYMTSGSLRQQVVYPHTEASLLKRGVTDTQLDKVMQHAHLLHIVRREGGWDAVADWQDVLSGGEKQRLGLARVFYHCPKFAFLDECTSAVSIDVEGEIYQSLIDQGIQLLTITHRPSLWKYHTHILHFDGEGGYELKPMARDQPSAEKRLSLREEKAHLEQTIGNVDKAKDRLALICAMLGEEPTIPIDDSDSTMTEDEKGSTEHL